MTQSFPRVQILLPELQPPFCKWHVASWHDASIRETWLIHTCETWLIHTCETWLIHTCETWLKHWYVSESSRPSSSCLSMRDMTHSSVRRDSFTREMWDMTYSHVRQDSYISTNQNPLARAQTAFLWVTCFSHILCHVRDMTDSYVWDMTQRSPGIRILSPQLRPSCCEWHASVICKTWLIHTCQTWHKHLYESESCHSISCHFSLSEVSRYMWVMTHSLVWMKYLVTCGTCLNETPETWLKYLHESESSRSISSHFFLSQVSSYMWFVTNSYVWMKCLVISGTWLIDTCELWLKYLHESKFSG